MCLREKIGPDPRNFNQRVSLGRNDLLIRTFPKKCILESYNEAFKDSTRSGYAGGGLLRLLAQWPMILYLPSWMTLPLPKNRSKGWLTQATWRSPATPRALR